MWNQDRQNCPVTAKSEKTIDRRPGAYLDYKGHISCRIVALDGGGALARHYVDVVKSLDGSGGRLESC
jgi:hypothetical protein